jgi:hypothetical protein
MLFLSALEMFLQEFSNSYCLYGTDGLYRCSLPAANTTSQFRHIYFLARNYITMSFTQSLFMHNFLAEVSRLLCWSLCAMTNQFLAAEG